MASASQTISDYFKRLEALIATFDFTRQGQNESMGKEAAGIVAEGILDRSISDQAGPDGAWLANDPKYTERKRRPYGVELIGVRTGQTCSRFTSLLGRVDVSPQHVEIHDGTGGYAEQGQAMHPVYEADQLWTDVSKAQFFTENKGAFFKLDTTIAEKVIGYFAAELEEFIRELNARQ